MSKCLDYEIAGADREWRRAVVVSPPGILEELTFDREPGPNARFYVYDSRGSTLIEQPVDVALGHLSGAAPALSKPDIGTFASPEACLAFIREKHAALVAA